MNPSHTRTWLVWVAGLVIAGHTWAQAPFLAKGNQEVNAFGGLSYGLDHWRGSFGANYAIAPFNKYIMLYGEYCYFPGIKRTTGPVFSQEGIQVADSGTGSFRFQDVHGGVHIRLPIFPEKRIVPYLAGGLGWLNSDLNGNLSVEEGARGTVSIPYSLGTNSFALNGMLFLNTTGIS